MRNPREHGFQGEEMRFSRDSVIGMALNVQIANAESRKPLENKAFHTLEAMPWYLNDVTWC